MIVWLIPAVAFIVLMFGWLNWHVVNTFQVGRELKENYARSEDMRDRICQLHQNLVSTAVLAVASSAPAWRDRHERLQDQLDQALIRARDFALPGHNLSQLWRAYESHLRLRDAEVLAFALADDGRRDAALGKLTDADYEDAKQVFSDAARDFVVDYRDYLGERLVRERDKEIASLVVAFVIFSMTLGVWVLLIRRLELRGRQLTFEVAERERAESVLRQREGILSQAQEIAHLGSFESEIATGGEYWSDEFYRILGYAPQAFPADREIFLKRVHPGDLGRLEAVVDDAFNAHDGYDLELRIRRPSGEERSVWLRAKLERSPEGAVIRAVGSLHDTTERKQIEARLSESREQLRDLAQHLQIAREQERAAVAQEIHDEMGQSLSALKADLFRLERSIGPRSGQVADLAQGMAGSIDTAIASVERIMSDLHPPLLDDLGLVAAIEWQLEQFQRRTGIRFSWACQEEDVHLSAEARLAMFRVLQEALTNVARHARASRVGVRLMQRAGFMVLQVSDNGVGISAEAAESRRSFGLMAMRERVHGLGGHLDVQGVEGEGTTLQAYLPYLGGVPRGNADAAGQASQVDVSVVDLPRPLGKP
jgi:PAS domain S-box-containing protein